LTENPSFCREKLPSPTNNAQFSFAIGVPTIFPAKNHYSIQIHVTVYRKADRKHWGSDANNGQAVKRKLPGDKTYYVEKKSRFGSGISIYSPKKALRHYQSFMC
jgi:hypothetical protein